jgi:hypothetical protein
MHFPCFYAVFIASLPVDIRNISSTALSVEKNSLALFQRHACTSNPTKRLHSRLHCQPMAKPESETKFHQRRQKRKAASSASSRKVQNRTGILDAAPLYITVGPQCCGKSTLLKTMEGGKVKDISLDDQPDVYVSVPTNVFLDCITNRSTDIESLELLQQVYQGKNLQERIHNDNDELGVILQRWNGDMSQEEFHRTIQALYASRELPLEVAEQLVVIVESYLKRKKPGSKPRSLPKSIDIFILESLFLPHPDTQQSAIQGAYEELRMTPIHIPIAWGNTNSKSRDYSQVLEIAFQTRRPVHFVICHPSLACGEKQGVTTESSSLITLPWMDLSDLLKRNLKRLKKTGRYIPAFSIADCCKRVESLVPINDANGLQTVEQRLVSLASPSFDNACKDGKQQRSAPPFKYALTKHHLIQKIFPQSRRGKQNMGEPATGRPM